MVDFIWLTAVESSEPVGVAVDRIAMIEQKARGEGQVVALHLDTGTELRVVESLERVRKVLSIATGMTVVEPANQTVRDERVSDITGDGLGYSSLFHRAD